MQGAPQGQIYLNEGKIVHAQLDDISGEEAVYSLAIWRGEFKFEPGTGTELIPSTDLVPEFMVQENREGQINLNTGEWLIPSKIDGHRSIKAIASAAGLSASDAAKVLYGLVAAGLIRLRDAGPAAPAAKPQAAPSVQAPAAGGNDLLVRLGRVREVCNSALGAVGESVFNKHYLKARGDLEKGAGA